MHCLSVQCTSVMLKLMLLSKCYMTFYLNYIVKPANAHLLSHLAKYVWLWGSLWMHSTFVSENLDFVVVWVATMILGMDADGTQKFLDSDLMSLNSPVNWYWKQECTNWAPLSQQVWHCSLTFLQYWCELYTTPCWWSLQIISCYLSANRLA